MICEYPKRPIPFCAAIITSNGKVLLVRRNYDPWEGSWSIPGSDIHFGETIPEALVRGVQEETGIVIDSSNLTTKFFREENLIQKDRKGKIQYDFCFIVFKLTTATMKISAKTDRSCGKWIQLEKLKNYRLASEARNVLEKAGLLRKRIRTNLKGT